MARKHRWVTRRRRLEQLKVVAAIVLSAVSLLAVVIWSQVPLDIEEAPVRASAPVAAAAPAPRPARAAPKPPPPPPLTEEPAPLAADPPVPTRPQPAHTAKASTPRSRPAAAQATPAETAPESTPEPNAEEPKPPPKESKKAAAGETGKLSLDTVPATEVYFGQNKIGDTPLVEVPLPAGHHALQVINDDKGISQSVEVDIRPGQTTKKRIQL
jgi:hypothetical protein